jgi:ZIP family zinc transporter
MLELLALATLTALATGLGALPVYWLGARAERLRPVLWGVVIGVMTVASVQGLLLPGLDEGADLPVLGGLAAGVTFLLVARFAIGHHDAHVGMARGVGARRALLVFAVLFVHSLPEGLALGSAWASDTVGLGVFVFLAIAIQNVPEGTATAIPLREAGVSAGRSFWVAVLTSAPQPVGALAAYELVEATRSLLGPSFGFAAGAMLALVVVELVPAVRSSGRAGAGTLAALISGVLMVLLGGLLEVG